MTGAEFLPFPLPEIRIWTVTELTRQIRSLLEGEFSEVLVDGEISNLRIPGSGHLYFTLKDEQCQLRGVMFRSQARGLKFEVADGLRVTARGRVTVYEPRGEYQLVVETLEPQGRGALQLAFEQLKEKLFKEGLFDEEHKKPIPLYPRTIGIVTSPTGAAIRDILRILERRFANLHVQIFPVRVQGDGASQEIARAIEEMNTLGEADVLIVGRGGGSLEDLWAFNEEATARAIYASRIPVISAVGHEIDFTIADLVADVRAPTPSAAAELVVGRKDKLMESLQAYKQRMLRAATGHLNLGQQRFLATQRSRSFREPEMRIIAPRAQRLDDFRHRLERSGEAIIALRCERHKQLAHALFLLNPLRTLQRRREMKDNLSKRLRERMAYRLSGYRQKMESLVGKLESLSPLAILSRGYSICRLPPSGRIIREATALRTGETLEVTLHKGEVVCRVEEIREDHRHVRTDV